MLHVQWEKQALARTFPRSWPTYRNDLVLMFEDETARDEAYSELDILWYDGDIRDMLPYPQTHHDKAQLTGASLKKLMLDRLPVKVLELMHTVDLTGNSDQEMIEINSPTGRAAEK